MRYFDFHCHIGVSIDGGGLTYENFVRVNRDYPSEYSVVFPIDEADKGKTYSTLNDRIMTLAQKDSRLVPFGRVNPNAGPAALQEMERFASIGMRGLKLHPFSEKFGPSRAAEMFRKAEELKLPVVIHSSTKSFKERFNIWRKVLEDVQTPVVIAHGGMDAFRLVAEFLPENPNLFADTTVLSYFRTKYIYDHAGPDQMLYGSDMPYSHPAIERVKYDLILTNQDKKKVFFNNAAKILNMD